MAGALVGGAFLSGFLQVAFDRLASRQVVDFFRQRKLDETLLNQLKITILSMDSLSDDAELKQFDDPRVRAWLLAVKDAVFDAEDLLDEIEYEVIKCHVEAESESQTLTHKVSNFFNTTFSPFTNKINSEMKQVLQKLEFLASQKDALALKRATYPSFGSGSKTQTTSLLVESVIYGRDEDKEMIFNWLKSETNNRNKLSILSVVGMGGLGKTTLAQHVYNDPRMKEADFDIKVWVCVSDDFDVLRLTKAILEAITGKNDDSGSLEMVHRRLKEELTGKRFLLVMDDVWNERRQEWEAVQTPLIYGAPGSTILVTTRSDTVASTMRSCKVLRLKQLEEDSCWQVFAKYAFQDDHSQLDAELKGIATKIIEKCKGLPLAIRSIGSLLRSKSVSEWENVLKSKIWDLPTGDNEIIPALLLSYHHLPSHLKRCFSFCALFPKDYEFKKEILIQLWMAQNFLQGPQYSKSQEEVGEQYFDDLLSRSFFQPSSIYRYPKCFVMHDLLNDLANYVSGDICFRLGVGKARGVPKTTRHFLIASKDAEYLDVFESLPDAKRLRTFFRSNQRGIFVAEDWECRISMHDLFSKFKFLHVLSLSHCSDLREVPDSLGELKHLRSLDLSRTDIEKLPDSTCLLFNLQILKLVRCRRLKELPTKLYKLTNLRCLEFRDSEVRRMPMNFGKLKNLQVLDVFCAGKSSEFSIRQLGGYNLRGELSIQELQNIEDPSDALAVDLINKTGLEKLLLQWKWNHIPDDPRKEKEVFENLQPSKHLKDLSIENYGGTQYPSWLSNNSLSNVVYLSMYGCKYCVCLPPLGLLPSLKELTISGFDGIVSVGAEFYGSSSSPFPSLETLYFCDMKEWEEWECPYAFPRLQSLGIHECPKLKGLSEQLVVGHAASKVEMSEQLLAKRMDILLPSLAVLGINDCPKVEMLLEGGLPSNLRSVYLTSYKLMASLKGSFGVNTCLESLHIVGVDEVECFPEEGFLPLSLTSLEIHGCRNLKKLDYNGLFQLSTLNNLIISSCPKLECLPEEGLPKSISILQILDCPLLKQLCQKPEGQDWGKIAHIQHLDIRSSYNLN